MADTIIIRGIAGFEGEYEVDQDALTWGDLRFLQRESGVLGGELDEHLRRGNLELVIGFAKLALKKAGHPYVDRFDEAIDAVPAGAASPITVKLGSEEEEPTDPQNAGAGPGS